MNKKEAELCMIIKKELQEITETDISDTDKFLSMGVDSLSATRLVRSMQEKYGINIRLKEFFKCQSVKELSKFIISTDNYIFEEGEI